ncbi:hypothetical protein [Arenimonas sp. GDDSR-1]|uniref:hypothetical protein n=1 Tax=Arenimonas sp. GDDSR-1 TaxID=2950125 RepID=UPI0031B85038
MAIDLLGVTAAFFTGLGAGFLAMALANGFLAGLALASAGFLAGDFFALRTGFLAGAFFTGTFLTGAFLAGAFLTADFFTGLAAAFLVTGFLATGFLTGLDGFFAGALALTTGFLAFAGLAAAFFTVFFAGLAALPAGLRTTGFLPGFTVFLLATWGVPHWFRLRTSFIAYTIVLRKMLR